MVFYWIVSHYTLRSLELKQVLSDLLDLTASPNVNTCFENFTLHYIKEILIT